MRQFWVVAGIFLMIISLVKTQEPPTNLTINKIERLADAEDGLSFNVCYDENEPENTDLYILIIKSGNVETLHNGTTLAPEHCVTFAGNIAKFSKKKVNFLLNALKTEDDSLLATGQAAFENFPDFPDPLTVSSADDPVKNDKKMLRVNGNMKEMEFIDIGGTIVSSELISYYLEVDAIPESLQPCITNTNDDILVCDVVTADTPTVESGPTVISGLLSYGYKKINLPKVSAKLEFEAASVVDDARGNPASDNLDIIFQDKLCTSEPIGQGACDIDWDKPGNQVADIRLVGVLGDVMQEAILHSIPDRELVGEIIGTDTYEARWLILSDSPNDDDKLYMLTKRSFSEVTDDETDETVYVDCSETTLHHCFGYFPGIKSDTYRITVQDHKKSEDYMINVQDHKKPEDYNGDKKIQSEPFTIPPTTLLGLEIKQLRFDWHQNDIEVNASVCFYHIITPDIESVFSHYEILIINGKGQWLKDKLTTHGTVEGDLCFTPLTINTEAFDVTEGAKVIVTQRAIDGFSVLSSGETTLS